MVHIEEVRLDVTIPNDGAIGMVIMQPHIDFETSSEPFCWKNEKIDRQIDSIIRTLEIAKKKDHRCQKTHFTIFPEYSIPKQGVPKIERVLRNNEWENGTVVIGGIDGLTKGEYNALCKSDGSVVHEDNHPNEVRDYEWVNCCIVWVKTGSTLKRWIQPKLSPSWPEKNIVHRYMFPGRALHVFEGRFENRKCFRFLPLICFDWIGPINADRGIFAVLNRLNDLWSAYRDGKFLNLIFVLQCNSEPNHYSFLNNAKDYFNNNDQCPFVNRNDSVIVFANSAGSCLPGKCNEFGFSCLISSPRSPYDTKGCPPSFAMITENLRNSKIVKECKEALLREKGACIHSFKLLLPSKAGSGPAGRCLPLERTVVHPIDNEIDDPRVPGKPVPASAKWINDQLDDLGQWLTRNPPHPLDCLISESYDSLRDKLRRKDPEFLEKYVTSSTCGSLQNHKKWIRISGNPDPIPNVDNWGDEECLALETSTHVLTIIRSCEDFGISYSTGYATIIGCSNPTDIIVVSGKEHEDCFNYVHDPTLSEQRYVIVVTRDKLNRMWYPEFGPVTSPSPKQEEIRKGPNFTDPDSRYFRCGYQNILDIYERSGDENTLKTELAEVIKVLK